MNVVGLILPLLLAQDPLRYAPEATKADLLDLKDIILRDLKDPASVKHANGLPDFWRMRRNLELACGWTDSDFILPLLAILDGTSEFRVHAAACLIRYRKPDLDRRVAAQAKVSQELLGGCFSYVLSIQRLMDDYKKTGTVDSTLRAANLEETIVTLQNGDPESRLKAWQLLASKEWFAPWKEYGLPAIDVWRATKKGDARRALTEPIVGADRAKELLAWLRRTATLQPAQIDDLTATRWRLGCDEERAAGRAILQSISEKYTNEADLPYEVFLPFSNLCDRPDIGNLDLYRRFIGRPCRTLREYGWLAIVQLDRDESFEILEKCWEDPSQQMLYDSRTILSWIQDIGRRKTANRDRWLDLLIKFYPKMEFNFVDTPAWIDTMASMAGRDFGWNGRLVPHGFDEESARKATAAILNWNATERKR